jgi:hypothetical protein
MCATTILPEGAQGCAEDDLIELTWSIFVCKFGRTLDDAWALALETQAELLSYARAWDDAAAAQRAATAQEAANVAR